MKATCTLIKKTDLEMLVESGDKTAVNDMIEAKEKALEEAINNAEFYASISLEEMADNEVVRSKRLIKDIEQLKAAI